MSCATFKEFLLTASAILGFEKLGVLADKLNVDERTLELWDKKAPNSVLFHKVKRKLLYEFPKTEQQRSEISHHWRSWQESEQNRHAAITFDLPQLTAACSHQSLLPDSTQPRV